MHNPMLYRALAGLVGVLFLLQAMGWLLAPAQAAEGLGMPLLDGVARSTQIGDLGAFFFAFAGMALIGAWTMHATWLYAGALLMAWAAFMRTVAAAAHGADFTPQFIVPEIVVAALLVVCGLRLKALSS